MRNSPARSIAVPAGLRKRQRKRETARRTQHAKTLCKARARTTAIFRHPRQGQAGLAQRLPERRFPAAVAVAIDGLRVGKIGKNPFCGLRNDILTFRHGVPRFRQHPARQSLPRALAFIAIHDEEKRQR